MVSWTGVTPLLREESDSEAGWTGLGIYVLVVMELVQFLIALLAKSCIQIDRVSILIARIRWEKIRLSGRGRVFCSQDNDGTLFTAVRRTKWISNMLPQTPAVAFGETGNFPTADFCPRRRPSASRENRNRLHPMWWLDGVWGRVLVLQKRDISSFKIHELLSVEPSFYCKRRCKYAEIGNCTGG